MYYKSIQSISAMNTKASDSSTAVDTVATSKVAAPAYSLPISSPNHSTVTPSNMTMNPTSIAAPTIPHAHPSPVAATAATAATTQLMIMSSFPPNHSGVAPGIAATTTLTHSKLCFCCHHCCFCCHSSFC